MQEDFKYNGKVYYFKKVNGLNGCDGCAFENVETGNACVDSESVKDCWDDIIWIEKK